MTDATVPVGWAEEPDDAVMLRLRDDPRALDLLVQRWSARMSHFFYRLTGDAGAVEDLLQELFLRVYRAREDWQAQGRFAAWIHLVARRLVYDRPTVRRPARGAPDGTTTLLGRIPDDAPTPGTSASRDELARKLDDALQQLDPPFREAVVLCDLQHLSYEEAAQAADCNVKTLSTRLARGRERLRELLAPTWGPPP